MKQRSRIRVTVVVLGDLGRSPRMEYHASALANSVAEVDVVGYAGSEIHPTLTDNPHVRLHLLRPRTTNIRQRIPRALYVVFSLLRVVDQSIRLVYLLLFATRQPDVILVQTPPAIPTLVLTLLAARLRAAMLVIDWHNFGHSILAQRLGDAHPLVRLARAYERAIGRRADAHLCVSRAMQHALAADCGIGNAVVLYDLPARDFAPTPVSARHEIFCRLASLLDPSGAASNMRMSPDEERTLITTATVGAPQGTGQACSSARLRPERPAVIVSPTSWTEDEDFGLLLEALGRYDATDGDLPSLLVLLTGEGPLRAHYELEIANLRLSRVCIRTLWLSPTDYPILLGSADLGLCLHRSTSGMDLPMKVADMFGAGLPVCAFNYGPCLGEQLRHGENGLQFTTSAELATQLEELLTGFPESTPRLDRLRRNVAETTQERWPDAWTAVAQPIFHRYAHTRSQPRG